MSKGKSKAFLRELRRKYGLGEFKKAMRSSSKKLTSRNGLTRGRGIMEFSGFYPSNKRGEIMARRRGGFRKRRSHSRAGGSSNLITPVLAAVGYSAIAEPLLDQVAGKLNLGVSDNIVKAGIGAVAAWKGRGIIKEVGKAALMIGAYNLGKGGLGSLGNLFSGGSTTGSSSTTQGYNVV